MLIAYSRPPACTCLQAQLAISFQQTLDINFIDLCSCTRLNLIIIHKKNNNKSKFCVHDIKLSEGTLFLWFQFSL